MNGQNTEKVELMRMQEKINTEKSEKIESLNGT